MPVRMSLLLLDQYRCIHVDEALSVGVFGVLQRVEGLHVLGLTHSCGYIESLRISFLRCV